MKKWNYNSSELIPDNVLKKFKKQLEQLNLEM